MEFFCTVPRPHFLGRALIWPGCFGEHILGLFGLYPSSLSKSVGFVSLSEKASLVSISAAFLSLIIIFFFFNDDIIQLLEATPDNLILSDLSISLPADNILEQREKLAVLVSTGKSKEALGSQLINRRNPFQTKMWRNIINCMRPTTWLKTTKTLIIIELFDAR